MPAVSENMLLFISGVGILQAFLLAILLYFHPRSDRSVNIFLAIYIICLSSPMFLPVGQLVFSWQEFIYLAPFTLLIGPGLYLYVRSFKETITFRKAWVHFVLFFVYLFIIWRITATIGAEYPPTREMPAEVLHNPLTIVPISIRMLQMLTYYFLSRRALSAYQVSIQNMYSETSRIDLRWVRWLITGYLVLVITTITLYSLVLAQTRYFNIFVLINAALITPYIYIAAFKGITQPTVWQLKKGEQKESIAEELKLAGALEGNNHQPEDGSQSRPNTPAIDERLANILAGVRDLMEKDRLFREPQLTLQHLAAKLQVPAYQVSQAINLGLDRSFYDLINGYRVEEAKRLLLDSSNSNYTILSVGFDAGFNSKTTFNTVFKKFTGLTPTEFRATRHAAAPVRNDG